jgi:hypothetical protein
MNNREQNDGPWLMVEYQEVLVYSVETQVGGPIIVPSQPLIVPSQEVGLALDADQSRFHVSYVF